MSMDGSSTDLSVTAENAEFFGQPSNATRDGAFRRSAQPGARVLQVPFRAVGKQQHVAAVLGIHRAECGGEAQPEDGSSVPSPSQRRLRWCALAASAASTCW